MNPANLIPLFVLAALIASAHRTDAADIGDHSDADAIIHEHKFISELVLKDSTVIEAGPQDPSQLAHLKGRYSSIHHVGCDLVLTASPSLTFELPARTRFTNVEFVSKYTRPRGDLKDWIDGVSPIESQQTADLQGTTQLHVDGQDRVVNLHIHCETDLKRPLVLKEILRHLRQADWTIAP